MSKDYLSAGDLRHRVTIRNAPTDATRNGYGERTATGTTLATVWASMEDVSGREGVDAGRETPIIYTRIVIRWRNDVRPDMTVTHDETGDEYRVNSVMDTDGTRRKLILMCVRNAAE
jgi:SPP1 family predicted phage head-tail adaptor